MTDFAPAAFLRNRHLQTIWSSLFRRPRVTLARETWQLPDGDPLIVHFGDEAPLRPGVVVLHGLEGSAGAGYVRGLLARVAAAGWNGAAFDFRSCGRHAPRGDARARGLYHAGKTDDLAHVVERLRARWGPATPIAAVGFSLGGNLLLKWLGETGAACPLAAAVTVSVPYDLGACARAIDAPGVMSFIYRERFLRSLRRKALRAVEHHPDRLDPTTIRACRTFAAYDGQVVARVFGFAGAEDYWSRCSARGFLAAIRRPTLLVSAADDPFIPPEAIPQTEIAANAALTLRLLPHGGHVGFVAGTPWRPRYHADDEAIAFLAARLAPAATSAPAEARG